MYLIILFTYCIQGCTLPESTHSIDPSIQKHSLPIHQDYLARQRSKFISLQDETQMPFLSFSNSTSQISEVAWVISCGTLIQANKNSLLMLSSDVFEGLVNYAPLLSLFSSKLSVTNLHMNCPLSCPYLSSTTTRDIDPSISVQISETNIHSISVPILNSRPASFRTFSTVFLSIVRKSFS